MLNSTKAFLMLYLYLLLSVWEKTEASLNVKKILVAVKSASQCASPK